MSESEFEQASLKRLPMWVDPRKLVANSASFCRIVDPDDLPRLMRACSDINEVTVDIRFDRDEQHRPVLLGSVKAVIVVRCQRCLDDMLCRVESDFYLAIVWDEAQAKALPRVMDPWIVEAEEANICAIVEEEILLHLPIVPKHESDCLDAALFTCADSAPAEANVSNKPNPFSVLADLKTK